MLARLEARATVRASVVRAGVRATGRGERASTRARARLRARTPCARSRCAHGVRVGHAHAKKAHGRALGCTRGGTDVGARASVRVSMARAGIRASGCESARACEPDTGERAPVRA
eukprot:6209555-Pleurochrysis_carterae.AAC.1